MGRKSALYLLSFSFVVLSLAYSQRVQAQDDAKPEEKPAETIIPYKAAANAEEAVASIEELGGSVRRVALIDESLEVDFHLGGEARIHYVREILD